VLSWLQALSATSFHDIRLLLTETLIQPRPALRGVFHLLSFVAAIIAAPLLIIIATSPAGYVGAAIFAASLILLYGTSASYHLIRWTPPLRALMKNLDHSMIFVLIAGTYTPFCLVAVDLAWGISILSIVWSLAGVGILLKLAWPGAPRLLSVSLYVGLGWLALVAGVEILTEFSASSVVLLIVGGVLYTIGGIVYGLRRPDPFPRVFGFHEIFHLFVIAGSSIHFWLIATTILPGKI
jgi:hemolysin III